VGYAVDNRIDVILNKEHLERLMDNRGFSGHGKFKDLWEKLIKRYDIGLAYGSFMNLLNNEVTWRLLYAYAICDFFDVKISEVFKITEVTEEMKSMRHRKPKRRDA
jgi:DNA-binding XRE family transcriptional regulator